LKYYLLGKTCPKNLKALLKYKKETMFKKDRVGSAHNGKTGRSPKSMALIIVLAVKRLKVLTI
jgi:hypothetical protein